MNLYADDSRVLERDGEFVVRRPDGTWLVIDDGPMGWCIHAADTRELVALFQGRLVFGLADPDLAIRELIGEPG